MGPLTLTPKSGLLPGGPGDQDVAACLMSDSVGHRSQDPSGPSHAFAAHHDEIGPELVGTANDHVGGIPDGGMNVYVDTLDLSDIVSSMRCATWLL